jgi:hypothetical protein
MKDKKMHGKDEKNNHLSFNSRGHVIDARS